MQLTRYTDYGLRVLIYLALLPRGQQASIDEISRTYDISRNNLNKIVHQLGIAGVVLTRRGKGGGLSLNVAPEAIKIGDMVVQLENNLTMVDCTKPHCQILPACKLKGVLLEATNAFINSLNQYRLSDLIEYQRPELINLLALEPPLATTS